MRRELFTILIFFNCLLLQSQPPRLSKEEKCWVALHPVAAIRIKHITSKCDVLYKHSNIKPELDSFPNGGRDDAFRHVFYMAAYAQKIRYKKLRKLGEAHEKGNYRQFLKSQLEEGERPDSLSTVMDLKNNDLGLAIGCDFSKLTLLELERLIVYEISKGRATIMKRNKLGQYLDCDDKLINLSEYQDKWQVP